MITYTDNQDGTSRIALSYSSETSRLVLFLEYAAKQLHVPETVLDEDGIPHVVTYDELTNQEKLDILDDAVREYLKTAALDFRRQVLVSAAAEEASNDPNTQL
jgi:hypothetical protein